MAESTRFIPEWMKAGGAHAPPSPTVKSFAALGANGGALGQRDGDDAYRYSRDDLLSLFVKSAPVPEPLKEHPSILSLEMQSPMAFVPLSEEEERQMSAIARGPPRGALPTRGRGAPVRGRGRGRGEEREWERGEKPTERRPNGVDWRPNGGDWRSNSVPGVGRGREERSWRRSESQEPGLDDGESDLWDDPGTGTGDFDASGVFREAPRRKEGESSQSLQTSLDSGFGAAQRQSQPLSLSAPNVEALNPPSQRRRLPSDSMDDALSAEGDSANAAISSFLQLSLDQQAANERDALRMGPLPGASQGQSRFSAFGGPSVIARPGSIGGSSRVTQPFESDADIGAPLRRFSAEESAAEAHALPPRPTGLEGVAGNTWLYKDPYGIVRGPFSDREMDEWFRAGYFPEMLPIKRVTDDAFAPLGSFVARHGGRSPFAAPVQPPPSLGHPHAPFHMMGFEGHAARVMPIAGAPFGAPAYGLSHVSMGQLDATAMGREQPQLPQMPVMGGIGHVGPWGMGPSVLGGGFEPQREQPVVGMGAFGPPMQLAHSGDGMYLPGQGLAALAEQASIADDLTPGFGADAHAHTSPSSRERTRSVDESAVSPPQRALAAAETHVAQPTQPIRQAVQKPTPSGAASGAVPSTPVANKPAQTVYAPKPPSAEKAKAPAPQTSVPPQVPHVSVSLKEIQQQQEAEFAEKRRREAAEAHAQAQAAAQAAQAGAKGPWARGSGDAGGQSGGLRSILQEEEAVARREKERQAELAREQLARTVAAAATREKEEAAKRAADEERVRGWNASQPAQMSTAPAQRHVVQAPPSSAPAKRPPSLIEIQQQELAEAEARRREQESRAAAAAQAQSAVAVVGGSTWAAGAGAKKSLAQIQAEEMAQQQAQQAQQRAAAAAAAAAKPPAAKPAPTTPVAVAAPATVTKVRPPSGQWAAGGERPKSLVEIQQEQSKTGPPPATPPATTPKQATSPWARTSGSSTGAQSFASPAAAAALNIASHDSEEEEDDGLFWDIAPKSGQKSAQPQPQQQQQAKSAPPSTKPSMSTVVGAAAKAPKADDFPSLAGAPNGSGASQQKKGAAPAPAPSAPAAAPAAAKPQAPQTKAPKEEEAYPLFMEGPPPDFIAWCEQTLRGVNTEVDAATFAGFLWEIESPAEVHEYARDYLGHSARTSDFARQFVDRRNKTKDAILAPVKPGAASAASGVSGAWTRTSGGGSQQQPQGQGQQQGGKKKKVQRVDPGAILGFSVNPS